MKNLFYILIGLVFTLSSCSLDDGKEDVSYELLPVNQVVMPESFKANKENPIEIKFIRPTSCHAFNSFYYDKTGNIRTVAIESIIYTNNGCEPLTVDNIAVQTLNFKPETAGEYTFKFWQGKDDNGEDIFLTYDIIVQP
ncbi:hypothetical protein [Flavobacterium sp.]|uniref:hypothetical protein n=1 Tax=Flavobacterium sp. TaxID=239 RepID=UPI0028BD6441|nr:hypothetical protein [Flavobacterium sp.]